MLDAFLETLPAGTCAAFEFRHTSWLDDEVFARLKARNLALCVADSEKLSTPVEITADYAYFRLRDEGYKPADIERWAQVIREQDRTLQGRVRVLQARGSGHRHCVCETAGPASVLVGRASARQPCPTAVPKSRAEARPTAQVATNSCKSLFSRSMCVRNSPCGAPS